MGALAGAAMVWDGAAAVGAAAGAAAGAGATGLGASGATAGGADGIGRDIGGELLLTVNFANGTPQLAADWVRHVNARELRVRHPKKKGLYLSAVRSFVFNEVLALRISQGLWGHTLPGDVLDDAGRPTGPLWGRGRVATTGQAQPGERVLRRPGRQRAGRRGPHLGVVGADEQVEEAEDRREAERGQQVEQPEIVGHAAHQRVLPREPEDEVPEPALVDPVEEEHAADHQREAPAHEDEGVIAVQAGDHAALQLGRRATASRRGSGDRSGTWPPATGRWWCRWRGAPR